MNFIKFPLFLCTMIYLSIGIASAKETRIHITTLDGQKISAELLSKTILIQDSSGKTTSLSFSDITNISLIKQNVDPNLEHPLLEELGIKMIIIPEGEYIMGDINATGYDNEKPAHKVTMSTFLMQKKEVTNAQYLAYFHSANRPIPKDLLSAPADAPVSKVNWNDANRFAQWLSQKTGLVFSLPSEAQWEYAARAGGMSDYSWGDSIGSNNAVCDGCGSKWDSISSAPVGSFPSNAYGLKDMHGNVWEWTQDCWHDNYDNAPHNGSAWTEGKCRKKVLRGGSWTNEKENLRTSTRFRGFSIKRDQDIGFRLVQKISAAQLSKN